MTVFDKRVAFKPYEYPEVVGFAEAIQHSFWLVSKWNFVSDIQDFKVKLNDVERNAVKNTMLAISQIEVSVKKFWSRLGDRFPKPEFEKVGIIFGYSEDVHADAYSKLLEILGLNTDFGLLLQNPVIQGRVDYLTKYLKGAAESSAENYCLSLTLFSIFIENVSLFSQFAIIKSIYKKQGYLKDIDNVIHATFKEELVHALFGMWLINQIKKEFPEWFNEDFYAKLERACRKALDAELKILDWIFEEGEIGAVSKATLKEFIKDRLNESLLSVGGKPVFEVDHQQLADLAWFKEQIYLYTNVDFFNQKSTMYSKFVHSFQVEDLFDD